MAINTKELAKAIDDIQRINGISRETILENFKESVERGFKKYLGQDDALIKINMDLENGILEVYQIKNVVKEVEDDFLEISVEDAKEIDKKLKVGDEYLIPLENLDIIRKAVVAVFKQKFNESERAVLYEQFKDKINTMITGVVETSDERGCTVNIGRTSVYLPRKEMIGDEKFAVRDSIKLYVNDVGNGTKGARIVVSRANEGFLRCIMSEEIHEIYDGTITIKNIARRAGERSKVAVYTPDANIDPAGSCIGPNGSRIQKICSQLGNGSSHEKIDIITYTDNTGLFIMETLKPARVVGVNFNEETKEATVVVKNESLPAAFGRKGVNVILASRLTGYKINIKSEDEAANEPDFKYQTFEELQAIDVQLRAQKVMEAQRASLTSKVSSKDVLPGLPEGYVAPLSRVFKDDDRGSDIAEALNEAVDKEEVTFTKKTAVKENKTANKVNENKEVEVVSSNEEKQVSPTPETPVSKVSPAPTEVKTTTTLEDLEKSLEKTEKKETSHKSLKKKKEEVKPEETTVKKQNENATYMSIYTEEELKAIEEEERANQDNASEDNEEDEDYEDYDDYYEDK